MGEKSTTPQHQFSWSIHSKQNLSKLLFDRAREEDEQSSLKSLIIFPLSFIQNIWLFLSFSSQI